ncbi:MAG: CBS domain-containing protein [Dechloromonas sp.]|uniref:CBS domain-containing protein n=1 Tax=Candidatus Dechloromonas phosphorivorans TaxID=2899244 RepID=A0A9D7LYB5_9RHOO|nr:CBS domain-containing protein [Candidatus Dechloromonas phosphorivorans]
MPRRQISNIIAGRSLFSASREMTVRAASCLMAENHIGALVVVENGRIVGIFTERDVLNKVLAGNLDPDTTTLQAVMVANPQTIRADRPLAHALHMMADGGFRHVPVVDADGAPLGMVSARDALGEDIVDLERDLRRRDEMEGSIGY